MYSLEPGTKIDRYTVLELLGVGGFGVVYLVEHQHLKSRYALKLLKDWTSEQAERLLVEGQMQASLVHPNVVRVTDTVRVGQHLGLVMEYVHGPTLSQLLAFGRTLTIEEIDVLMVGILEGVAEAHHRGYVHRDLKPADVLLELVRAIPVPKVSDFGLAKVLGGAHPGSTEESRRGLGTPGYMSLEQVSGDEAEPSMDVFALGSILFELIEGVPAFPSPAQWREAVVANRFPRSSRGDVPLRMQASLAASLCPRWSRCVDAPGLLALWQHGSPVDHAVPASQKETLREGVPPSAARSGPLPAERDRFVGRERDLRELDDLISSGSRLVTVHGPGGIGKTRLAVRYASRGAIGASRIAQAWFCDASGAATLDELVSAVAAALGVPIDRGDPVPLLGRALLGRGRGLLVIDGVDRVVEHAPTLSTWLDAAPAIVILTTSRVLLGLRGEQLLTLDPLPLEAAEELFHLRAEAAHRGYERSVERADVRALVEHLHCIPLAIELCAPRVRLLPVADMLGHLVEPVPSPAHSLDRPARQATLRATLDWSWDLLSPWERQVLCQCSVFRGGFSVDAAEGVLELVAAGVVARDVPPIPDVLQSLIEKSLVIRRTKRRLDLLRPIRAYAEEKLALDSALAQRICLRHAAWFARRRSLPEDLKSFDDLDNIVIAMQRAMEAGEVEMAGWTAYEAASMHRTLGPLKRSEEILREVQRRCDLTGHLRVSGALWHALSATLQEMGRASEAIAPAEEALTLARASGDASGEALALCTLGSAHNTAGALQRALEVWNQGLAVARAHQARHAEATILANLAQVIQPPDLALFEQAISLQQEAGDRFGANITRANLAVYKVTKGKYAVAARMLDEVQRFFRANGRRRYEMHALANLGDVRRRQLRYDEAESAFLAAENLAREMGARRHQALILGNRGQLASDRGRPGRALLEEAASVLRALGDVRYEAVALRYLGQIALRERADDTVTLLQAALAGHRASGDTANEGETLALWAELQAARGAREEVEQSLSRAQVLLEPYGLSVELGFVLCSAARAMALVGEPARAKGYLEQAKAAVEGLERPPDLVRALDGALRLLEGT